MNTKKSPITYLVRAIVAAGVLGAAAHSLAATYQVQFFAPGVKAYYLRYFDAAGNPKSTLSFPTVVEGSTSAPVTFTIQNVGAGPLAFSATPFTVPAPFSLTSTTCAGSLAPAATCTATLTFSPQAAKTYSGQAITVSSTPASIASPPLYAIATSSPVVQLAVGDYSAYVQKQNGTWWATGNNNNGQLGLGDTANRLTFTQVPSLAGAVKVITGMSGAGQTLALFPGGVLKSSQSPTYTFTPISGITTSGKVAIGWTSTFVQLTDGSWVGKGNGYGELGLGDTVARSSFVPLPLPAGTTQVVATGFSAYAQRADGAWLSSGRNYWGTLGLGDYNTGTDRNVFTLISTLPAGSQIYGGEYEAGYAQLPDTTYASTGNWIAGNRGDGYVSGPFTVFTKLNNIGAATKIYPSIQGLYAQYADGTVLSAGYAPGLLASDYGHNPFFSAQPLLKNATNIASGYDSTRALLPNGTLMVGGFNNYGQLGTGDTTSRGQYGTQFVQVIP